MKRRPAIDLAPWLTERALEKFSRKYRVDDSGCWVWTGALGNGYGSFGLKVDGSWKSVRAHRVTYTIAHGPISPGLDLDHLCRNTRCVNPNHLEAVSPGVNTLRSLNPPAQNARKTHCKRGHEFTPENTYVKVGGKWRECRICRRDAAAAAWIAKRHMVRRRCDSLRRCDRGRRLPGGLGLTRKNQASSGPVVAGTAQSRFNERG